MSHNKTSQTKNHLVYSPSYQSDLSVLGSSVAFAQDRGSRVLDQLAQELNGQKPLAHSTPRMVTLKQLKLAHCPCYIDSLKKPATWAATFGHPAYSGTIMTTTFQIVRELGWDYLEKLSKQRVMQVQSSTDPPKKLSLGERAIMADGNEYNVVLLKEAGQPVEPIYPAEGTPTISGPTAIFATAPHPNAARLFQAWMHTRETQQFFTDFTAQYSAHPQVTPKPGRRKISDIKLMKEDAAGVEKMADEIKTRYARLFRV